MRIEARAKINWALNVTGIRPDGRHDLDMLTQRLDLADTLTIVRAQTLTLELSGAPGLSDKEDNLALRAARLLQETTGYAGGARMRLNKRIPLQAGLGGGSADAAAALEGLNELWQTGLTPAELARLGALLGSDVPLCLCPGLARVRGAGEDVRPIPGGQGWHLVLLQPREGLSTGAVFRQYDLLASPPEAADIEQAADALVSGNAALAALHCRNQLQPAAEKMLPAVRRAVLALLGEGAAFARMTGSGSAVFGVFGSRRASLTAQAALRADWPVCLALKALGED